MLRIRENTDEIECGRTQGPFRVVVRSMGEVVSRILAVGGTLRFGSGPEADVRIADPTVSALHCELIARQDGVLVRDLGSRNGVLLGNGKIEEALLRDGRGEILIGRSTLSIGARSEPKGEGDLGIVGASRAMEEVRDKVRNFGRLRAPVLILGESGTGKDVVARAIYRASELKGPYVATNVAALADTLIDAELFGHARGAFTGAVSARAGAFQLADQGLLFLDEIAELSPGGQAKLLRVVEDGKVRPVGSEREIQVNARTVFATCADLDGKMKRGEFRHDLFHRISILTIELPPLRRRPSDIPLLARHYLDQKANELGPRILSSETLEFLSAQKWPGNVRQLFASIYAACASTPNEVLLPPHFQLKGAEAPRSPLDPAAARRLLEEHGSLSAAARAAQVPRTTFRSLVARSGAR
jgi:DNA-binding NtrC family response regulator